MLTEMWKGNPVLTTVIFGLPSGFLMLICYSIHCTDILDADEDDIDDGKKFALCVYSWIIIVGGLGMTCLRGLKSYFVGHIN